MIVEPGFERSAYYYETLGLVPEGALTASDFYRFQVVKKHLYGKSVLDAGCARANFLRLIRSEYQIAGIEVTQQRADVCNKILGSNAVIALDLESEVDLADNSYDTVVCMEVLEHLVNPRKAFGELARISRFRIIITVPFNEKIKKTLCVHCAKYTPYHGHLHSFDKSNIRDIIPDIVEITELQLIYNRVFNLLPRFTFRLPYTVVSMVDRLLNRCVPKARWMLVVMDKKSAELNASSARGLNSQP